MQATAPQLRAPRALPVVLCLTLLVMPGFALAEGEPEGEAGDPESSEEEEPEKGEEESSEGDAAESDEAAAEEAPAEADEAAAEEAPEAAEEDAETDAPSEAAPTPEPTEEAEEAPKGPEVDLVAELGAIWLHGNTKSITANGLITLSVSSDGNKFGWNFGGSYGRGLPAATEDVPEPEEWVENARRIFGGVRYDRSITDINSVYFAGNAVHDSFAGLQLRVSGDVGYSHKIVDTDKHDLTAEAGFNYSYDLFLEDADPADQHFAGARLFVSYGLTFDSFGFSQSVEAILGGRNNIDAPFDGRVVSTTAITANVNNILGVKFGFLVNYDISPPEGFEPVDTTATLTLVATLM